MRQSKDKARVLVTECAHPRESLQGAGDPCKKQLYCSACMGRWEHLSPKKAVLEEDGGHGITESSPVDSLHERGSLSANPAAGQTLCHCKKPAYRWQVKKKGPTLVFKCQNRVCDYFLWDPMEQAAIDPKPGWMPRIARRSNALASVPQRKHSGFGLP